MTVTFRNECNLLSPFVFLSVFALKILGAEAIFAPINNPMFEAFIERNARIARSNQVLIALRLFFATVSLAVLIMREQDVMNAGKSEGPLYFRPPGFLTIIVLFLTIVYLLLAQTVKSQPRVAARLAALQIFVDIALITGLVWKTGGIDSQFVMLYLISICSAGFVLKWNASIVAAIISSILYSGVAIAYSVGAVPEEIRNDPTKFQDLRGALTGLSFLRFLLLPIFAFISAGIISGTISKRLVAASLMRDDILEGIGKGILMLDSRRCIVYHNREFTRLLGIDAKLPPVGLARVLGDGIDRQAIEVLKNNAPNQMEILHTRSDGKSIPIMVRINPIAELDGGEPHGLIIALDDITVEKKMAEFAKHRQRIETMGQLSATIAHEIRNPLASIRGAVQEIVRALDVPENKKILLEIVLSESDRLDQIITDFLHFARMRPPGLVRTDMKRVLSDVRYLLTSRPESRDVQISVAGETGDPIAVDPEQLRQLLLNLGLNALQAMEGGTRKQLRIHATRQSHTPMNSGYDATRLMDRLDRPAIVVAVEDSGAGMTPEILRQVFEPFFTTKPAGTGLGLAIVERIVHQHDGMIAVESSPGRGTTIKIWLPADLKVGAVMGDPAPAVVL